MLANIFVSEVRVKLLRELTNNTDGELHVRDLTRRVGTEVNAIRRELTNLEQIDLVFRRPHGNRVYYKINKFHPLYPELLGLLGKEFGLGRKIIDKHETLGKLSFATLRRNFVDGTKALDKQIDLMLVGDVNVRKAEELIAEVEKEDNTSIHFTVLDNEELKYRKQRKDPFLMNILLTPKVMLLGIEEDLVN